MKVFKMYLKDLVHLQIVLNVSYGEYAKRLVVKVAQKMWSKPAKCLDMLLILRVLSK